MWFPHNMDFRGRAYPMPPHLNHLGSDTSRGILQFAEGRALGEHGLEWLYVQVEQPPLPPWLPTCFLSPGVAYGLSLLLETSPAAFCKVQRGGCVAFLAPCTLPQLCRPSQPISLSGTASHLALNFTAKKASPLPGLMARCARAQITNSWGQSVDKGSYAERKVFVRDHLDLVLDSAERPFDGHK